MKKIIVVALGMLSNGEITIAIEVLRRINKQDAKICFVIHEKMSKAVLANGFQAVLLNSDSREENLTCFREAVKTFQPDFFLCADVFTMDFSATWSGVDFDELKAVGIPIGTFDEYEWESTHFLQDFAGVPMRMKSGLITKSDFLVRPCPVNRPETAENKKIINCSLLDIDSELEAYKRNIAGKTKWKTHMGIKEDSKVVLVVNSPWEYVEVGRSLESVRLLEWVPKIIQQYLSTLKIPITVLHVGGREWTGTEELQLDYKHFSNVPPKEYTRMIHCADLFCGTNMISVTLSRAVLCGVPSVLFQNDKIIDFERLEAILDRMPAWYLRMAKEVKKVMPFKVFPWGWYRFLEPVMRNNGYEGLLDIAPIFKPQKCVEVIRRSLLDEEHKKIMAGKLDEYIRQLKQLEPSSKILEIV